MGDALPAPGRFLSGRSYEPVAVQMSGPDEAFSSATTAPSRVILHAMSGFGLKTVTVTRKVSAVNDFVHGSVCEPRVFVSGIPTAITCADPLPVTSTTHFFALAPVVEPP